MHRLNLILTFILTASVGLSLPTTSRPNFVFIIGDDISAEDFGCYGNPGIHTPNIDRLAAQGLRFTNAYLTASSCSPSRSSIFTSRYPHNLETAAELHGLLPEGIAMFPKLLRDSGYYTAHAGKAHFGGESDVLSGPALAAFDLGGDGERVCETSANRGTLAPVLRMKEGDCSAIDSAIGPAIVHQRAHSPQRRLVRAVVDKDGLRVPAFAESRGADA